MVLPVCVSWGASQGCSGGDLGSEEVLTSGTAAPAVTEELEEAVLKKGTETQETPVVALLTAWGSPSLDFSCLGQWLVQLSEGTGISAVLQNRLGAEYAETTDRSEEDSRKPVSTSVSWTPSKSSMEKGWLCLRSDALGPLLESHCSSEEEAGEGPSVGKQNKDLLLWKHQGGPWELLAGLASSCWCWGGRCIQLGPGRGLSIGDCRMLP